MKINKSIEEKKSTTKITSEDNEFLGIASAFSLMSLGAVYDFSHNARIVAGLLISKEVIDDDIVYILVPLNKDYEEIELKLPLTGLKRVLVPTTSPVYGSDCAIADYLDSSESLDIQDEADNMELEVKLGEDDGGNGIVVGYKIDGTVTNQPQLQLLQYDENIANAYNYFNYETDFPSLEKYLPRSAAAVAKDIASVAPTGASTALVEIATATQDELNLFTGDYELDINKYLGKYCKLSADDTEYKIIRVYLNKSFLPTVTLAKTITDIIDEVLVDDLILLPNAKKNILLDNEFSCSELSEKEVPVDHPLWSVTEHTSYRTKGDVQVMGYGYVKYWSVLGVIVCDIATNEYTTVSGYTLIASNPKKKSYSNNYNRGSSYSYTPTILPKTIDAGFAYEGKIPAIIEL